MKGINDIGNGRGFIYVTDNDSKIELNIKNDRAGVRAAKLLALQAAPFFKNTSAAATITINFAVPPTGNITAITIDTINQIGASLLITGLTNNTIAAKIATEINKFAPAGSDYTAIAISNEVIIYAPPASGSTANNKFITVTTDFAQTSITTTLFAGGSEGDQRIDKANGYRFFLDADYGTGQCTGDGTAAEGVITNAIEITNDVVVRSDEKGLTIINKSILADTFLPERQGQKTIVILDTEALAVTDDLVTIDTRNFIEGDEVEIRGKAITRKTTIHDKNDSFVTSLIKNIKLKQSSTYVTDDSATSILFRLAKNLPAEESAIPLWLEVSRSVPGVASVGAFRTADGSTLDPSTPASNTFPIHPNPGSSTMAVLPAGFIEIKQPINKQFIQLTGTVTLTGNFNISILSSGLKRGDVFYIYSIARVTTGAFLFTVSAPTGVSITVPSTTALSGFWWIYGYYDGTNTWLNLLPDFSGDKFRLEPVFLNALSITKDKLETTLTKEAIILDASFETGEQGDHKIELNYPGTITKIFISVKKVMGAADAGTVTVKNNALAVMATVSIPQATIAGTTFAVSPTANNTFIADDDIIITTAKTTSGGKIIVTLHITR